MNLIIYLPPTTTARKDHFIHNLLLKAISGFLIPRFFPSFRLFFTTENQQQKRDEESNRNPELLFRDLKIALDSRQQCFKLG